jgi:hypothetical protein
MFFDHLPLGVANLGGFLLLLVVVSWRWYTLKHDSYVTYKKRGNLSKSAPLTFPYYFPLLGTLPIQYLWDPRGFVLNPE